MATTVARIAAPCWLLLVLVLAAVAVPAARAAAAPAAAANATDVDVEDDDDDEVDFPDDESQGVSPPRRRLPTPVSIYVLRLLEILTGAETFGKHTRFSRSVRSAGCGRPKE